MKQAILRDQPDSYSKLCSSIYRCYATSVGKAEARWGDKNNHYIHQIELLKSLYPSASFVFLVRDPRDVLASARTLKLRQHKSIYAPRLETDARKFAREWIEQQRIVLRELSLLGSKRSVILQYEQLVTEPDLALMPALQLLGVQWQDEILSFWKTNVHKHTEPNATTGWKSLTRHPLTSSRIGRWHALVTDREDAEIKQEARETMMRLGYANWTES